MYRNKTRILLVIITLFVAGCAAPTAAPDQPTVQPSPTPPPVPTRMPTGGAEPTPTTASSGEATDTVTDDCTPDLEFVSDVNYPPGAEVPLDQPFIKIWQVRNSGTCGWHSGYQLVRVGGNETLSAEGMEEISVVAPGAEAEIQVTLRLSPDAATGQRYNAAFQFQTADGTAVGPALTVDVTAVAAGDGGIPTPTPITDGG